MNYSGVIDLSIAENVKLIREKIDSAAASAGQVRGGVSLVAATKAVDAAQAAESIAAGVSACGENRVQEMLAKNEQGAYSGAPLHFIGHLQKNKVKHVVGLCSLIQSVDSLELLSLISKRAEALNIRQDLLLEINIAQESSKAGIPAEALDEILSFASHFPSIFVRGLMAIPPISYIKGENRPYFAQMYKLFVDNSAKKYDNVSMDFLSMGMSGDFEDAILEGSNMVRVGSAIFGGRT